MRWSDKARIKHHAGGDSARRGNSGIFERRSRKLRRVKWHMFFRVIGGKTGDSKKARKHEPRISGT